MPSTIHRLQYKYGKVYRNGRGHLFIQNKEKQTEEYKIQNVGSDLLLYLRQLNDITEEQSKQLIEEGFSIGRPHGYTFSANGFLYLLSLSVDLFGLIKSGLACDITQIEIN